MVVVGLASLTIFLVPLIALLLSHDTITRESERGTLLLSSDWLLRLRHDPFYDYLERRTLDWIAAAGAGSQRQAAASAPGPGTEAGH